MPLRATMHVYLNADLPADHRLVGLPCRACRRLFVAGDAAAWFGDLHRAEHPGCYWIRRELRLLIAAVEGRQ